MFCSHTALHPGLSRPLLIPGNSLWCCCKISVHPKTVTCVVAGAHPEAGTSHIRNPLQAQAGDKDTVHKDAGSPLITPPCRHPASQPPSSQVSLSAFSQVHKQPASACLPPSLSPTPSFAPTEQKCHRILIPITKGQAALVTATLAGIGAGAAQPSPAIPAHRHVLNRAGRSSPTRQPRWV